MNDFEPLRNQLITQRIDEQALDFFEAAPCGYLFTALDGKLLRVNQTFRGWMGYGPDDPPPGTKLSDLISRGSRIYFETHFFPHLNVRGTVEEINLTLLGKGGHRIPVLLSATQHRDAENHFLFNSVVVVNYAHRQRYESELLDAKKRAESSDRAKSYFLSTISHEVLTPLNAIIGMAGLLDETGLNEHQREYQTILSQSAKHLLQLFKNILVISKDGLGKLTVARHSFDLRQVVHGVAGSFRHGNLRPGVTLNTRVSDHLPPLLIGDSTLLTQLLTNLIGNAVKFTASGEVSVAVEVQELTAGAVTFEVAVSDTGIGIPAHMLDQLFVPFTQASRDIHSRYGGSGLGLSICNRILDKLDSHMEVSSEEGKGSRFSFVLRLPVSTPQAAPTPAALSEITRGRVLLVEDNETNAYLVTRYFQQWQLPCDLATDGAEALRRLEREDYDVILMDMQMPVMDGYTAARCIRQLPGIRSRIPIIAFSASSSLSISQRMQECEIDDFLLKPFEPRELHSILLRYLPVSSPQAPELTPTAFPQLREAFDHDTEELSAFAHILERELDTAATQLSQAIAANDGRTVGDLKHKLKTSLHLLDADRVRELLLDVTTQLKEDRPVEPASTRELMDELRSLVTRLRHTQW